jgi:hypothetical protein
MVDVALESEGKAAEGWAVTAHFVVCHLVTGALFCVALIVLCY